MTTSSTPRAATPGRVWIPLTGIPAAITLGFTLASRAAVDEEAEGVYMALALTFLVITCIVGPLVCVAWRLHNSEIRTEDRAGDACYRLRRLEKDYEALSIAVAHLSRDRIDQQAVGWVRPVPTTRMYAVQDEDPERS